MISDNDGPSIAETVNTQALMVPPTPGDSTASYVTTADESADLPNSRQILAGTNITLDVSVPNELTVNAAASSVTSVNGQTGVVVLTAADVGAQPSNANLTAIAGLASAADTVPYFTGSGAASLTGLTAAARSVLDDTTIPLMRTTLDLDAIGYNGAAGAVFRAGSATANTWPKMTVGTLLTTPENGAFEMDANAFYVTTKVGSRGVVPNYQLIRQDATYTLANQGTSQQLFNASTNGRLTLGTGTYLFEAMISLSGMSATSGNAAFSILGAGGATIAAILYLSSGIDSAAGASGSGGFSGSISSTSPQPIVPAGISTALQVRIHGTFEISVAGTIVPSITLNTAIGTVVVAVGSYFLCHRIGSTTLTTIGQWD